MGKKEFCFHGTRFFCTLGVYRFPLQIYLKCEAPCRENFILFWLTFLTFFKKSFKPIVCCWRGTEHIPSRCSVQITSLPINVTPFPTVYVRLNVWTPGIITERGETGKYYYFSNLKYLVVLGNKALLSMKYIQSMFANINNCDLKKWW